MECWVVLNKGKILSSNRSGSLPEILIYLPDEGHFSTVPGSVWIQFAMRHGENNFC